GIEDILIVVVFQAAAVYVGQEAVHIRLSFFLGANRHGPIILVVRDFHLLLLGDLGEDQFPFCFLTGLVHGVVFEFPLLLRGKHSLVFSATPFAHVLHAHVVGLSQRTGNGDIGVLKQVL